MPLFSNSTGIHISGGNFYNVGGNLNITFVGGNIYSVPRSGETGMFCSLNKMNLS
jgi:hypothetical protein